MKPAFVYRWMFDKDGVWHSASRSDTAKILKQMRRQGSLRRTPGGMIRGAVGLEWWVFKRVKS